jgi:hypothetical protein
MEKLFKQYAVPFIMRPLPGNGLARAAEVAREVEVQAMPKLVTVIVPRTSLENGKPRTQTQTALAFIRAYGQIAPKSFAAKPNWHLNHAARGDYGDTTSGTVEK